MDQIIKKAKALQYHSMTYVTPESSVFIINENDHILIGEEENEITTIYWAANTLEDLIKAIKDVPSDYKNKKCRLKFIPEHFIEDLKSEAFYVESEFVDFWIKDLKSLKETVSFHTSIRPIHQDEIESVALITQSCKNQSRGFDGELIHTLNDWVSSDGNQIMAAYDKDEMIGICLIGTYLNGQKKVAWLRELAVDPKHQNKGVGRLLISHSLKWAINENADQSFLATDIENKNAIHLYESFGYQKQLGRGEIVLSNR